MGRFVSCLVHCDSRAVFMAHLFTGGVMGPRAQHSVCHGEERPVEDIQLLSRDVTAFGLEP